MTILRNTLIATTLAIAAHAATQAATVVMEYQTVGWATSTGVQNTVAAVSGLSYGGKVTNFAQLGGADIVVAGSWNSAFTPWVAAGGVYVMHDWNQQANALPGLGGLQSAGFGSADVNVIDATSPIVNGPFGTISNTTMDGGNWSVHPMWQLNSLTSTDPLAGALHAVLSSTSASAVVMFEMAYGSGHILYAGIPLEAYTDSSPLTVNGQPAGLRTYARNEMAYAYALTQSANDVGNRVPEPAGWALALVALGAVLATRRRAA